MKPNLPNGVLRDPRPITEKKKDYLHEVRYSGLPVSWKEKSKWNLPSERLQDGSSSCVKQASATAMEILTKKIISAGTYRLRANFPEKGMWLQDCGNIDKNIGAILEAEVPSQNLSESTMNSLPLPKNYTLKITEYRQFGKLTIDAIAEAIQAYGHCILTFESNSSEWGTTPKHLGGEISWAHAICGADYGLKKGKKVIACRDSAGSSRVRYITEDFLANRNTGALYYTGYKIEEVKPSWTEHFLTFIKWLQNNPSKLDEIVSPK